MAVQPQTLFPCSHAQLIYVCVSIKIDLVGQKSILKSSIPSYEKLNCGTLKRLPTSTSASLTKQKTFNSSPLAPTPESKLSCVTRAKESSLSLRSARKSLANCSSLTNGVIGATRTIGGSKA